MKFFKKINREKRKFKFKQFNVVSDALEFQIEAYKEINMYIHKNLKKKLNNIETDMLKKFLNTKPFKISVCDKNIGSAIISNENYDIIVHNHLNDISTYKICSQNPLKSINTQIQLKLDELFNLSHINSSLFNCLLVNDSKLGSFRPLMKLHKSKFSIRPIINSIKHPTSNISLLLDSLLQPFVVKMDSYLRDSQSLIQKCENIKIPPDSNLLSADFEGLYTNIDHEDALNTLTDFMTDKLDSKYLTSTGFYNLLSLVLNCNFFFFKDIFYQQIKGVAMGTIVGPSIANLYIYVLEKKWLNLYKPFFFSRYIDDIFMIFSDKNLINSLSNNFKNLKLNTVVNTKINFLDLNIEIDTLCNKLIFSLYLKPTNTFNYLLTDSNHPPHIFKNIPKSLFIRIRRNNSQLSSFLFHARLLTSQLVKRGYNFKKLRKIANCISKIDRSKLLNYKEKCNNFSLVKSDQFLFKSPYDTST